VVDVLGVVGLGVVIAPGVVVPVDWCVCVSSAQLADEHNRAVPAIPTAMDIRCLFMAHLLLTASTSSCELVSASRATGVPVARHPSVPPPR
jgi:hypothetical protein